MSVHDDVSKTSWDPARLATLKKVAAELYPCETEQRRLVHDAALSESAIAFNPSADASWSAILDHANEVRQVPRLLDVLLRENTHNELLHRLKEDQPTSLLIGSDIHSAVAWRGPANASALLEQILGSQSALVPVSFLALGLQRARAVAKVRMSDGSSGSGFLIGDNILITNNHVLPDSKTAASAVAQFNYQQTLEGLDEPMCEMKFKPKDLFETSETDDWSAVRVEGNANARWGALKLQLAPLKAEDRVNIIQHPGGGYKQISFFSNVIVFVGEGRVQYLTDTMPGSSGSPVFDRNWNVVALHHSGGWLTEPGSKSKKTFFRNEGIHIDAIVKALTAKGILH